MKIDFETMTDTELAQLVADAQSALASRATRPTVQGIREKIRYAEKFGSYNERRYSRPWIARVSAWPVGGKPELEWGRYVGDDHGGEAEIMARPGDVIRYGQKDTRGNGGSSEWCVAQADGTLDVVSQPEARKQYNSR